MAGRAEPVFKMNFLPWYSGRVFGMVILNGVGVMVSSACRRGLG